MKIDLINKDVGEFSKKGNNYTIDFGIKQWGGNTTANLKVETLEKLTFAPTCSCTVSENTQTDYGYNIFLVYDSKRKGSFSKIVKVVANGKLISEITLKGKIL